VNHSTSAERERVLQQMTSTYLSLDTNAFKLRDPPARGLGTRDLLRIVRVTERIVSAATRAREK
jgi:hypothetical protein